MKCEVCGFQIAEHPGPGEPGRQAFKCVVCGRWFCSDHAAPFYNCRREQPAWLCPEHRQSVTEYIESLKPKVRVRLEGSYYHIEGMTEVFHGVNTVLVPTSVAEALYEYMRREHEGKGTD